MYSSNVGYHDTQALDGLVDEVYQEDELPTSFIVEPSPRFDYLVGDADDIQTSLKQKQKSVKRYDGLV
jgi:hypothetical protein